jgi:hypothetical protein
LNKPVFALGGIALALLDLIFGYSPPDFRTFSGPVMTTEGMERELPRLHEINLTVSEAGFDPSPYPISVGVDARNGKMLVEKFICWDACPDVGMVFLLYQSVGSAEACADVVVGTPLFSPAPIPGDYWGCRPVVDWLDSSERPPAKSTPVP